MGIVSVAARIGGIVSPFMSLLDKVHSGLQFTVLGSLMLVTGLSALLLPETVGQHLPETIEEIEDGDEDKRPLLTPSHLAGRSFAHSSSTDVDEGIAEVIDSSEEELLYTAHHRPKTYVS